MSMFELQKSMDLNVPTVSAVSLDELWVKNFSLSCECYFGDAVVVDLPVHQSPGKCD